MESIQIWLPFPQSVIQLGFEGNAVVEIPASAKRGSLAQSNVLKQTTRIGVDVLITEKRAKSPELSRHL
jgi:hypothetical protein